MIIRPMEKRDAEPAAKLEEANFSEPWTKKDFMEAVDLGYAHYFVAEIEGNMVGCAGLRNIAGEGEITNVAVDAAFRRRGIGAKLIGHLLERGSKLGVCSFTLEVRAGNDAAVSLYRKYGFAEEGVRKHFYKNPREDALIMWKR